MIRPLHRSMLHHSICQLHWGACAEAVTVQRLQAQLHPLAGQLQLQPGPLAAAAKGALLRAAAAAAIAAAVALTLFCNAW